MSTTQDLLKTTNTVWKLSLEVRRPHSGAYVVLVAQAHGASGVDHLVALELASAPVSQDILAEFETGVFTALEGAISQLVGVQELLGLE